MTKKETLVIEVLHPKNWMSLREISLQITILKRGNGDNELWDPYYSVGTICAALDSLEDQGFAEGRLREPTQEEAELRGGRKIREARLTGSGLEHRVKHRTKEDVPHALPATNRGAVP